jgi:hypothetical protein
MGDRLRGRRLLAAVSVLIGTVAAAVVGLVVIGNRTCSADTDTTYRGRYAIMDGTSTTTGPYSSKLTITRDAGGCT